MECILRKGRWGRPQRMGMDNRIFHSDLTGSMLRIIWDSALAAALSQGLKNPLIREALRTPLIL
jgi:hypothetical protein